MRQREQASIKVHSETGERVRFAATISGRSQSEIVAQAVDEFVKRHEEDFVLGLKRAREALLGGREEAVAYLLGEEVENVKRVAGAGAKPPAKPQPNRT